MFSVILDHALYVLVCISMIIKNLNYNGYLLETITAIEVLFHLRSVDNSHRLEKIHKVVIYLAVYLSIALYYMYTRLLPVALF